MSWLEGKIVPMLYYKENFDPDLEERF